MKLLADPQTRRPWVLIPLKELFYVKSRAREDTLAFIYQPRFRLTNGRTHSHICGIIYSQIRLPFIPYTSPVAEDQVDEEEEFDQGEL